MSNDDVIVMILRDAYRRGDQIIRERACQQTASPDATPEIQTMKPEVIDSATALDSDPNQLGVIGTN